MGTFLKKHILLLLPVLLIGVPAPPWFGQNVAAQSLVSRNQLLLSLQDGSFVGAEAGDINGDSFPDVAICDRGGSRLLVLFGSPFGIGSIQQVSLGDLIPEVTDPTGGLSSLDVADVDKDGDMDVAISVDGTNDEVLVLYNPGSGFSDFTRFTIRAYPVGGDPTAIKFANLTGVNGNDDGAPELVIVNRRSATLTTMINNGAGQFGLGRVTETGGRDPVSQALGDFNDDGKIDTAVLNRKYNSPDVEDSLVTVLLGKGDGAFQLTNYQIGVPRNGVSLAAAGYGIVRNGIQIDIPDINNDGITDLAVVSERGGIATDVPNQNGGTDAGAVVVLSGNRQQTGQFTQANLPQPLQDPGTQGVGRFAIFPGATDKRDQRHIGYGAVTVLGDFNQNGQLDLYAGGLERTNGQVSNSFVGAVGDNFAASMMSLDKLGTGVPPERFVNVFPSDFEGSETVRAQAPFDVDAVTGVVTAGGYVVSQTGRFVQQNTNDLDGSPGNSAPDFVQVTVNGLVYESVNQTRVSNHAPLVTTQNGRSDFTGPGRKIVVAEGAQATLPLKVEDLDGPPPETLEFSLVDAPTFVSLKDNRDGTASLLVRPQATDGSATANNGLGQEYFVTVQVFDQNFRENDNNQKFPLYVQFFCRIFVKDKQNQLPVSVGPNQTMFATQTLQIPVIAKDPSLHIVTLSTPFRAPFATFVDQGGGLGAFTFRPTEADIGTYPIQVFAQNDLGLSGSASFTLFVKGNTPPSLVPFSDLTLFEDEVLEVPVTAFDPDPNQQIRLSLSDSPGFVALIPTGNGKGLLQLTPRRGQQGVYSFKVMAADNGTPPKTSNPAVVRVVVQARISLTSIWYLNQRLFINGFGFASMKEVLVNGESVPIERILPGFSDNSLTLKGTRRQLRLKAGSNTIQIIGTADQESNVFVLQL
ncbi:MAG: VCBS repeat-containing protein [Blastocatellia bacterium]|nr:VCBS repeat-containing protein [Blastocatellia bacterium]